MMGRKRGGPPLRKELDSKYFSDEFLFDNCCEKYELHSKVEDLNREESFPHNLHQLSNYLRCDVLPHKHELEKSNEEAGRFPITSISDFYESEELVSLATHGDDKLSIDPMFIESNEISPHFPDLQIE